MEDRVNALLVSNGEDYTRADKSASWNALLTGTPSREHRGINWEHFIPVIKGIDALGTYTPGPRESTNVEIRDANGRVLSRPPEPSLWQNFVNNLPPMRRPTPTPDDLMLPGPR
jgi:hypothetical protein